MAPPQDEPQDIALGGTDWFLVMTDRAMARQGSGAVCHLVAALDTDAPIAPDADAGWAWLRSLRLVALPPLIPPRWRPIGDPGPAVFELAPVPDDDALVAALPQRMELRREPGVRLTRVVVGGAPSVVLSWHHGLMDARTAERLLQRLGGVDPGGREAIAAPVGLLERLKRAWRARDAVYASSVGQIAWTLPVPPGAGPVDRLRRARIGGDELAAVDAAAQAAGAGMLRGTYHIAVTARAVAGLLRARGIGRGDMLITSPQDQRRGAVARLGNGITVLFYRVAVDKTADLPALVRGLAESVRTMLRDGTPMALMALLEFCRLLPTWLYAPIVRFPTWGRVATFGVSDTGDTLGQLTRLFGAEVTDARHIPANLHPPGVTVIFSRQRGLLDVVLRYRADRLTEDEADGLLSALRQDLAGGAPDAR